MSMEKLSDLARILGAQLHGADAAFPRVVTDTRALQPGDLFVALAGERFDAHDFLADAAAKGAVGALVSRRVEAPIAQVQVADTLDGLQRYAADWRRRYAGPVIGVTGSNGKTTTKQLLAALFAARGPVLYTEGNLNNHIGVPLTLCRLRADHATAVIEMGANHAGEIALLASLARPQVGIVTQAGDAHLEGFGSREGVAQAKGEMFEALGTDGTAIINADDAYAPLWTKLAGRRRIVRFGFAAEAEVSALAVEAGSDGSRFTLRTPAGIAPVQLPLPGAHNVANALAAAAAGHALGLSSEEIAAGLARVEAPKGRVAVKAHASGARLIDDSYNANPTSLDAAVQLLARESGTRLLVLGDMAELGPDAARLHAEAGARAKALGLDGLHTVGPLSQHAAAAFGSGAAAHRDLAELVAALRPRLAPGTTVLVKGSRSARMERVVAALTDDINKPGATLAEGHH